MLAFLFQHQFWVAVVLYWIFSAAVSSMPEPAAGGTPIYTWLFRFLYTVAGNISIALGNKIPGTKTLLLLLLLAIPLLMSIPACAALHATIHPGALNQIDSTTYDSLLVAQAAIDDARPAYEAGRLPANTRAAFDTLVRSYNAARQSWLTYRGAIATQVPDTVYFSQLNQNLTDLATALRAFLKPDADTKDPR
jgi:hypothetical protein